MKLQWRRMILLAAIGLLGMCARSAFADSIALRDGQHVHGKFAGGTQGVIAFLVGGTTQYYNVKDILVMTFEEENDAQANYGEQQSHSTIPKADTLLPQSQKNHHKPGNPNVKSCRSNTTS